MNKKPRRTKAVRVGQPSYGGYYNDEALKKSLRKDFEDAGYRRVYRLQEVQR